MDNKVNIEEKKKINGKEISKAGMITGVIIAVAYNVFSVIKTGNIPTPEEQQSILMLSSGLVLFFSPVYLSIWLSKIFDKNKEE